VSDRDSPSTEQSSRKLRPHYARGECADDERGPLIPTPAYALTAARFPVVFALARFGFAGDNGSPNLSRLPIMGECSASTSQSQRIHSVALLPAGARVLEGCFMAL
jgi:hypothetical protein